MGPVLSAWKIKEKKEIFSFKALILSSFMQWITGGFQIFILKIICSTIYIIQFCETCISKMIMSMANCLRKELEKKNFQQGD